MYLTRYDIDILYSFDNLFIPIVCTLTANSVDQVYGIDINYICDILVSMMMYLVWAVYCSYNFRILDLKYVSNNV